LLLQARTADIDRELRAPPTSYGSTSAAGAGTQQQMRVSREPWSEARHRLVVLLQGIEWRTLAVHRPAEFLRPARVSYDLPSDARAAGVQLRWWQPRHRGAGHDQWAIDRVEIVAYVHLDTLQLSQMDPRDGIVL